MNQLELILENIRLSHIEKILLESSTQMEAQRGIDLINESIYAVAGSLMEEMVWKGTGLDKNKAKMGSLHDAAPHVFGKGAGTLPTKELNNRIDKANLLNNARSSYFNSYGGERAANKFILDNHKNKMKYYNSGKHIPDSALLNKY
jgi:hypothetical protein